MPEHEPKDLGIIKAQLKSGDEVFRMDGEDLGFDLLAYWQWSASDLLNNTSRGTLAEFIVAQALDVSAKVRRTWDEYDLITDDGVRIEVKSSAYIQAWGQKGLSTPRFGIGPSRKWEKEHAGRANEPRRHSDVYVFAMLHHTDQNSIEPMDLSQWTFYVLATSVLDRERPGQKTIGLRPLKNLGAQEVSFDGLRDAVNRAATGASP